jgi:hypothetical protein
MTASLSHSSTPIISLASLPSLPPFFANKWMRTVGLEHELVSWGGGCWINIGLIHDRASIGAHALFWLWYVGKKVGIFNFSMQPQSLILTFVRHIVWANPCCHWNAPQSGEVSCQIGNLSRALCTRYFKLRGSSMLELISWNGKQTWYNELFPFLGRKLNIYH